MSKPLRMETQPTTADRIAVCQHPDGPGEYVPAEHVKDGRCFMDCDCTPRIYVALDSVTDNAAVERAALQLGQEARDNRDAGYPWALEMGDRYAAQRVLEAALTATGGTDVVPNHDDPASSGATDSTSDAPDDLMPEWDHPSTDNPNSDKDASKGKGLNDG